MGTDQSKQDADTFAAAAFAAIACSRCPTHNVLPILRVAQTSTTADGKFRWIANMVCPNVVHNLVAPPGPLWMNFWGDRKVAGAGAGETPEEAIQNAMSKWESCVAELRAVIKRIADHVATLKRETTRKANLISDPPLCA